MSKPVIIKKVCEPYVIGGNVRRHHKVIAGPVSYETGGVELLASDISDTWFVPPATTVMSQSKDRIAHFVFADEDKCKSVRMFITGLDGTEVANASDQSTKRFIVEFNMNG